MFDFYYRRDTRLIVYLTGCW